MAFCEIEEYPRKVLAKHWPSVPIHRDIRELDGKQYRGTVELVCGGFPCQPFSQAGQRRGSEDDRALWPEMLRIIREVQPTWVICENVIGLETMGLEHCISDLESNGFEVQTFDIPACGVGAIHRRHRLWIVARNTDWGGKSTEPVNATVPRELGAAPGKWTAANPSRKRCGERRATRDFPKANGRQDGRLLREFAGSIGRPTESTLCGTDDGISHRMDRLRGLGNAVVPQIPEILGRAILEHERVK